MSVDLLLQKDIGNIITGIAKITKACSDGRTDIAEEAYDHFNLKPKTVHDNMSTIIRSACKNNHMNVILWLNNSFLLTRKEKYRIFKYARIYDRPEIIEWVESVSIKISNYPDY